MPFFFPVLLKQLNTAQRDMFAVIDLSTNVVRNMASGVLADDTANSMTWNENNGYISVHGDPLTY